jgi:hypothetical protein
METKQGNNPNPSGVWQGIWAFLYNQFFFQMTTNDYFAAWETAKDIETVIPPECQKEAKIEFDKASSVFSKHIVSYNYTAAYQQKERQINNEAPTALRELIKVVTRSLYSNGWINKDFNIQPLNVNRPHITSKS